MRRVAAELVLSVLAVIAIGVQPQPLLAQLRQLLRNVVRAWRRDRSRKSQAAEAVVGAAAVEAVQVFFAFGLEPRDPR